MSISRWIAMVAVVVLVSVGADSAVAQGKDKAKDLIVGKWEADDAKAKEQGGLIIEFAKDGSMTISIGKLQMKGKYKLTADDTLESVIEQNGKTRTEKMKVEVTRDTLITTELEGAKEVTKFKRIAANQEGVKVAPEGGQFRAVFPGKPTESSNPPNTKDSKKATQMFTWVATKDHLFMVTYLDLSGKPTPKDQEMKLLEALRDNHAKNRKGEVVKDEVVERGGLSGRQFTIKVGSGLWSQYVLFVRNDRLYQAIVIGSEKEVGGKEAEQFLKSFEVITEKEKK